MITRLKLNKKGSDFPSIIYAIGIIFAIGIVVVVVSYLASQIYTNLQDTLNENPEVASSSANETLTKVITWEQSSMWDYFFLAIALAYLLSMMILAWMTPTHPWLFAILTVLSMLGLFIGVALSNAWEKFSDTSILASTMTRFPITDLILDNFYPLFITIMIAVVMVMLFGKRFLESGGGGMR